MLHAGDIPWVCTQPFAHTYRMLGGKGTAISEKVVSLVAMLSVDVSRLESVLGEN